MTAATTEDKKKGRNTYPAQRQKDEDKDDKGKKVRHMAVHFINFCNFFLVAGSANLGNNKTH